MLVIRALREVRGELPDSPMELCLCRGELAEAERNPNGAVSAQFAGGELLGLKPDEYEIIRDDDAVDAEIERLQEKNKLLYDAMVVLRREGCWCEECNQTMKALKQAAPTTEQPT